MQARKAAGIEDTEEEKAKGHAAGIRVFGKLKKHISKNKSNVATAFNQFDDDNSGALTPSELRECLGSLGIALENEEFEVMVRLIDSDGDMLICSSVSRITEQMNSANNIVVVVIDQLLTRTRQSRSLAD